MDDVNPNAQAPVATAEPETAQSAPQQTEQTAETPEPAPEKTVPYSRFAEVNKGYRETQRRLAEIEGQSKLSKYAPEDMDAVLAHPYVQDLSIKYAKAELTAFTRDLLDGHPEVNPQLRKAILANVRGFVKESTTDVESAKVDIQEYVDQILEGEVPAIKPKEFPVAATGVRETASSTPAEVQKILEKPVDEWTKEDSDKVDQYKKNLPKR